MFKLSLVAAVLATVGVEASAQGFGSWYFEYIQGDQAEDLNACSASINFPNAWFSARLFGEELDFIYYRDDFTLPYGQVFGSVIFRIDGQAFTVLASTNDRAVTDQLPTSQVLFFWPGPEDKGPIFNALRNGRLFWIEFPNGDYYEFPLAGSGRAFQLASDCWASRPTGPVTNNPFSGGVEGNNPFGSL